MMGFGFVGLLLMVLFWALLIAGAFGLVRAIFPGGEKQGSPRGEGELSPRAILDRRYARGEITRAQYEQMRGDLEV
jgi:putative membrane protein